MKRFLFLRTLSCSLWMYILSLRGPMRFSNAFFLLLVVSSLTVAQDTKPADDKRPTGNVSFSPDMLDKNSDPCTDFYAYACGKWKAQNPIPSDQPAWGRFNELQERGQYVMRDILEKYSADDPKRSPVEQKIGDYYQACMDESAIEKRGTKPLAADLAKVAEIKSKQALATELITLHRAGANAMFTFDSTQDFKDASEVTAEVDQGGMALPDKDYYLKDDAKSVELRTQYVAHVQKMFELLGDSPAKAASEAKVVMDIETALAKGALDRVSRRDAQKVYHRIKREELAALTPDFNWNSY